MLASLTVVIVGAGFSGVLTACHLLRSHVGRPVRVIVINRSGIMARGVAYGTRSSAHLLNVPTGRMSAFADDPDSFLRFARQRDVAITAQSFVPRQLYGDYLEQMLQEAEGSSRGGTLERMVGEVAAIDLAADGQSAQVSTSDGQRLHADRVVLALGNYAPDNPAIRDPSFYETRHYVRDPWAPRSLDAVDVRQPVLLIGTGLTMLDVALELHSRGGVKLLAVARRGLVPQTHQMSAVPPAPEFRPPAIESSAATARTYLRAVREQVQRLAHQGIDWRTVIDALRPITPALWQRLGLAERQRFLRHVRPFWEVHRHRTAPAPGQAIQKLLQTGSLAVRAGRLRDLRSDASGVEVTLQFRGQPSSVTLRVGSVINCTGPSSDLKNSADPLITFLRQRGLIHPDPLGLGLVTGENYALIDASGNPSSVIYYVGPLLRASFWESTAVPELRVHAARLVEALVRV